MPGHGTTLNRYSIVQLNIENRRQRAHLKKISEMHYRSGLDNTSPLRLPHITQNFRKKLNEKKQEIVKENEILNKKLRSIVPSKDINPPAPPSRPTTRTRRHSATESIHENNSYVERIAKARGKYDTQEWRKQFDEHKEHLRLRKDSRVFTPLGMGTNRRRSIQTNVSSVNSKRTTPSSSSNFFNIYGKKNRS